MFGINGGFALEAELSGKYLFTQAESGQIGVFELLKLLPGGLIVPIVFTILAIGFLATSLDSAAFSLSAVSSKQLDKNGNTNPFFRLFWCLVLAVVPLSIMFSNAPFNALKTLCIFLSVPYLFIIVGMNIGLFKWFKQDTQNQLSKGENNA
jgi:BCCT family betaine/carnitine transporter